jgi:hypothetical protein
MEKLQAEHHGYDLDQQINEEPFQQSVERWLGLNAKDFGLRLLEHA